MRVCRLRAWTWCSLVLLMVLVGGVSAGRANDSLLADLPGADNDFLRFRPAQWISLTVDVEKNFLGTTSPVSGTTIGSLTVLPGIVLQWPEPHFRPYINAGLGLSIGGLTSDTTSIPLSMRFEEKLMLQIGGGIAFDLGKGFSLTGSTYFSREKTTDLLSHFSTPSYPFVQDDLEVNAYTVELGIRFVY